MLMSGVVFVLVLAGCWVYCLIDAALTPNAAFRGLPKAAWIGIIAATFILGGIAWLCYRATLRARPRMATGYVLRSRAMRAHTYVYRHPDWAAAELAFSRHPAGRFRDTLPGGWTRPLGPDDDPDFLAELDRRIKGTPTDDAE